MQQSRFEARDDAVSRVILPKLPAVGVDEYIETIKAVPVEAVIDYARKFIEQAKITEVPNCEIFAGPLGVAMLKHYSVLRDEFGEAGVNIVTYFLLNNISCDLGVEVFPHSFSCVDQIELLTKLAAQSDSPAKDQLVLAIGACLKSAEHRHMNGLSNQDKPISSICDQVLARLAASKILRAYAERLFQDPAQLAEQYISVYQAQLDIMMLHGPDDVRTEMEANDVEISDIREFAQRVVARTSVTDQDSRELADLLEKPRVMFELDISDPVAVGYAFKIVQKLITNEARSLYLESSRILSALTQYDFDYGKQRSMSKIFAQVNDWLASPMRCSLWQWLDIPIPDRTSSCYAYVSTLHFFAAMQETRGLAFKLYHKALPEAAPERVIIFRSRDFRTCVAREANTAGLLVLSRARVAHGSLDAGFFAELGDRQGLDPSAPQYFAGDALMNCSDDSSAGLWIRIRLAGIGALSIYDQIVLLPEPKFR